MYGFHTMGQNCVHPNIEKWSLSSMGTCCCWRPHSSSVGRIYPRGLQAASFKHGPWANSFHVMFPRNRSGCSTVGSKDCLKLSLIFALPCSICLGTFLEIAHALYFVFIISVGCMLHLHGITSLQATLNTLLTHYMGHWCEEVHEQM